MGLFSSSQPVTVAPSAAKPANPIPITQIDTGKWYDVYCAMTGEDRLYEKVRFVGARTFERITEYSSGSFLEIETADGTRALIPRFGIHLICEHGVPPIYKGLRQWGDW